MSGSTRHIDNQEDALNKSMEEYRQQLIKEGNFKEGSKEFDSLMSLHLYFESTPNEKIHKMIDEVNNIGINGPTVEEYFQSQNPAYQYHKGYTDSAKKFFDSLNEKFTKEFNSQLKGVDVNGNLVFVNMDQFSKEQIISMIKEVYEKN